MNKNRSAIQQEHENLLWNNELLSFYMFFKIDENRKFKIFSGSSKIILITFKLAKSFLTFIFEFLDSRIYEFMAESENDFKE